MQPKLINLFTTATSDVYYSTSPPYPTNTPPFILFLSIINITPFFTHHQPHSTSPAPSPLFLTTSPITSPPHHHHFSCSPPSPLLLITSPITSPPHHHYHHPSLSFPHPRPLHHPPLTDTDAAKGRCEDDVEDSKEDEAVEAVVDPQEV